jgi:signal transduction histidine kinase/nitrogen-specific signal transduction histidine kinase
MKRNSLHRTLFFAMGSLGILGILVPSFIWGYLQYYRFHEESQELRKKYLLEQKENVKKKTQSALKYILYKKELAENSLKAEIKERTYEAHKTATHIYNKYAGKKSKDEIAKLIHDSLYAASWNNGKGYYFAEDMEGNEIINRNNPELEGKNIWDLQDSNGVYIMRRIVETAKSEKGEGFCSYQWNRPGHPGVLMPKFSFVKYFQPLDWVIGNGKYLQDKEEEIKQEIIDYFEKTRTDEDGYIFIGNYEGVLLTYPAKNENLREITDVNGKKFIQEIIQTARQGSGFVSYVMPKLGEETPSPKTSYCMGIPDWEWFIGTGVYTDKIETIIQQKETLIQKKIIGQIIDSIILISILLLLSLFLARFIAKKISNDFQAFSSGFAKAADESKRIPEEKIHFKEFEQVAKSANHMIEERLKSIKEKENLQKQLEIAHKMEAIGLMAGGVAHDLNNTLAAMINIPQFILSKMEKDDPNRELLLMILDGGQRSASVVQDLLTISQGIVRKTKIEDLNELTRKAMDSMEFRDLREHFPDISIELDLCEKPLYIDCSAAHINKLIYNLVSNSVEAVIKKGSVEVKTTFCKSKGESTDLIEIPPGKYALLEVADNGQGIAAEDLERIFEPFFTKKNLGRSGTGLGLTVVWNTVKDHHGYIKATSDTSGTKIYIYFPIREKPEEDDHLKKTDNIELTSLKKQKIMIVDDEKLQHIVASKILEKKDYSCVSFFSGEEAVEYLKQNDADLILLDMLLGNGINGKQTYQEILKFKPEQKAVIVTGFAKNEDVKATLAMGAFGCLHKPYSKAELEDIVYRSLK